MRLAGAANKPLSTDRRPRSRARLSAFVHSVINSVLVWLLYDAAMTAGALALAYTISPRARSVSVAPFELIVFPILFLVCGGVSGLYERKSLRHPSGLVFSLVLTSILAAFGLALFWGVVFFKPLGRYIVIITVGLTLLFGLLPRICALTLMKKFKTRLLLIGSPHESSAIAQRLEIDHAPYLLTGFCSREPAVSDKALGSLDDLPSLCQKLAINKIIVSDEYIKQPEVLEQCFKSVQLECEIQDEKSFFEESFEMILVDRLDPSWFFSSQLTMHKILPSFLKRALDMFIASVGLILTAPLFVLIWIIVRLTSWGPVLYSQVRLGQFGRPFSIYKFRSMTLDAERNGAVWATRNDPRVTPFGYFLRKTRLDEIPQFWNILRGDMSFVGPRPERPEMAEAIEKEVPFFAFRHWARPGLTGLAQIRYQYGSSIADAKEKLQHDLYYIKNWSLLLDLQIILRTFSAIMKGSR